ncbi:hypothetical protein P7C70_g6145, partial [Phenoliferia sp. Uapishka_3]
MASFISLLALSTLAFAAGPSPVNLGTSGNYAVLAKTGVSTVPKSSITGDLGASPVAQTYYTGFSNTNDETNTFSTSSQVTGRLYAADNASPTPSVLTTAVSDMETAYTDASSRSNPDYLNLLDGNFGEYTFGPGLYNWGSDVSFNGDCIINGTTNDTFLFQVTGEINVADSVKLTLIGGAQPGNVVFVSADAMTLGNSAEWNGIMLSMTAIHLKTSASIVGRLLAQSAVTLDESTVQSNGLFPANNTVSSSTSSKRSYVQL